MEAFVDPILLVALGSERMLKLPVFRTPFNKLIKSFGELLDFLYQIIEQHEEQLKDSGYDIEPRDFVEAYLIEMKRCETQETHHYFS